MHHTVKAEGLGVRLRPVRKEDAAFIVWLRNLDHAKGRVGDSATEVASQEAWLDKYFNRLEDYYFIIETLSGRRPVGTYGLWDFTNNSAESGRWIIRTDVPAAIPSAILGLDIAFSTLKLSLLRVKTVSTNLPVLSLNRKFGMRQTRVETDSTVIGGRSVDQIHFVLYPQDWAQAKQQVLGLAKIAEQQIGDWERTESQRLPAGAEATGCSVRANPTTPVCNPATAGWANPGIQL